MQMNNLLTNKNKTSTDTKKYFAIEIGFESVKSACWEIAGIKPNFLQAGSLEEYQSDNPDSLITAIDKSLIKACEEIEPEPNEAVFSLPQSWVEDNSLAANKKKLLKEITSKLELKAIGFVITTEALVHYLKHKQGGPFTGILVSVGEAEILVTVSKNGDIVDTQTVGRSDDLGADVEEGLARFGDIGSLPANMVLFNGHTDLETLKQEMVSYDWQERLPFLHIPKIDIFSPQETIQAIVNSAGAEVIKSLEVSSTDDLDSDGESDSENDQDQQIPNMADEFGFSSDFNSDNLSKPDTDPLSPLEDESSPQDETLAQASQDSQDLDQEEEIDSTSKTLPRLKGFIPNLKLPSLKFGFQSGKKNLIILITILIFFISSLTAAAAAYWYYPTANVTIFVEPKIIDQDITFSIDPEISDTQIDDNTIPGKLAPVEFTDSSQTKATGEKLIGDPASGKVTLYNRTDSSKTFEAGTQLTGPDNLTYTIDEDVTIASASTKENDDFSLTTEPSTASVSISSADIGAKYNLGSGTEFAVANFDKSSFVAKASGDITGGTSRTVTAVAKADHTLLIDQLTQKLEDKITNQLGQDSEDFVGSIPLSNEETTSTEDFSAEIGEEADSVTLALTLSTQTLTYKKSDLSLLIEKEILNSITQNFQFQRSQSQIDTVEVVENKDGTYTIKAKAKAKIIPIIDPDEVTQKIKGRFPSVTQDYFNNLPNFNKVAIEIKPKSIPSQIKTFPRLSKNIQVEITTTEE